MNVSDQIKKRFMELHAQMGGMRVTHEEGVPRTAHTDLHQWATSVLSLLFRVFGQDTAHYSNFKHAYDHCQNGYPSEVEPMKGVFLPAKADYEGGYLFNLTAAVSGEIFGDFVGLAKAALSDGHKDVAAVLACAALEDALKRFAELNTLDVANKDMTEVVNALKTKGLVSGAQKSLLDTMPRIRNYALHAEWSKITPQDAGSVLGFVEQFLLSNFS